MARSIEARAEALAAASQRQEKDDPRMAYATVFLRQAAEISKQVQADKLAKPTAKANRTPKKKGTL